MVKPELNNLSATKLRAILIATMVLLFIIGGALFWFLRSQIIDVANHVREVSTGVATSNADVIHLQNLQRTLDDEKEAIDRAASLVGDSSTYQYQEKMLNDVTTYAKKTGISIVSINFDEAKDSTGTTAGLKEIGVTLAIESPVEYSAIMKFIRLIEYNLPKMQIADVSFTGSTSEGSKTSIQFSSITIKAYAK